MTEAVVKIKEGREKPIINRHPWVFSGAIKQAHNAINGELVRLETAGGDFLAQGYWNSKSQIQLRILTWQEEAINEAWWLKRIEAAIQLRHEMGLNKSEKPAYRVVHSENDYLPGLIVDRYDNILVIQASTLYIDTIKKQLANQLVQAYEKQGIKIESVYERSDVDSRKKEGLNLKTGLLLGNEPPEKVEIIENGTHYYVDIRKGNKTGFYLDQRSNRDRLRELALELNRPLHLLNLFAYTGGFGTASQGAIKQITHVDISSNALELARQNYALNNMDNVEFVEADAFEYLRSAIVDKKQYDIIVLDPPKFAQSKQQIDRAARGYKDLNLQAINLIQPGGYLMTYSCSGAVSQDLFQKIVFGALADTNRQGQIIEHLHADNDHPIALTFPEGEYLKGLLVRIL